MNRLLYVVSREQPLLSGYLMTRLSPRSADGRSVEIKVDERRAERRQSSDSRHPERRTTERRLQPDLDKELRSRGYATAVRSAAGPSRAAFSVPTRAPAWRRRSSWLERAGRAGWRSPVWWGVAVILLAVLGAGLVAARSIDWTSDRRLSAPSPPAPSRPAPPSTSPSPPAPQVAPRIEKSSPVAPALKGEAVAPPALPAPPPSRPAPVRTVRTRSTGVVLSVDPQARMLLLEDREVAGAVGRLRVEVAPDARIVLSVRDDQAEDLTRPFKDTVIDLAEVRRGDYVVVERRGPEGKELARSVVVTLRPTQ